METHIGLGLMSRVSELLLRNAKGRLFHSPNYQARVDSIHSLLCVQHPDTPEATTLLQLPKISLISIFHPPAMIGSTMSMCPNPIQLETTVGLWPEILRNEGPGYIAQGSIFNVLQ